MKQKSKFIYYTGIISIIFVMLAFGIAAMVQPHRIERYFKPFVIIHIILSMGWLILFIQQSRLAQKGQLDKHRKNVNLATTLVVLSTLIAIYITYQWGDFRRLIGESRDILVFAILFFTSIWAVNKGRIKTHKRLLLIALMNLIGPAFARVWSIFGWPQQSIVLISLLTWIVVPISYDLVTNRKIHKATYYGVGFTLLSFIITVAIISSPFGEQLNEFLYGKN